jgi:metal-dependent HD superfamily phosphatase/phosphodiesterase
MLYIVGDQRVHTKMQEKSQLKLYNTLKTSGLHHEIVRENKGGTKRDSEEEQ